MPGPFVFDGSGFSCLSLIFQMHENALLIAIAIVKIAERQAFKVGIHLRFGDAGMGCVW